MNEVSQIIRLDKMNNRLIYVALSLDGLIKIGVTKDYRKREKGLSNTEHGKIVKHFETGRCTNSFEVEKLIHEKMKPYQHFGEWYKTDFEYAVRIVKEIFSSTAVKEREIQRKDTKAKYRCDTLLDYFHRNEVEIN